MAVQSFREGSPKRLRFIEAVLGIQPPAKLPSA
jgi:hypothetical protein